jgi:hypothetical protein
MELRIPPSVKREHEELHHQLKTVIGTGGKTGEMAGRVERLLHPHFEKEEEYALPPLGILPDLAKGIISPEMAAVVPLTDRLKADLPRMIAEHRQVVEALNELAVAARHEGKEEGVQFAQKLQLHASGEEEVTYPAAILVGEYLRRVL